MQAKIDYLKINFNNNINETNILSILLLMLKKLTGLTYIPVNRLKICNHEM